MHEQALEHRVRHRLAGLDVHGEALQDGRLLQPVLVKLRRKFDEIRRDTGAPDRAVGDVGKERVQRVAELVKERVRVIKAQERRRAGRRL